MNKRNPRPGERFTDSQTGLEYECWAMAPAERVVLWYDPKDVNHKEYRPTGPSRYWLIRDGKTYLATIRKGNVVSIREASSA